MGWPSTNDLEGRASSDSRVTEFPPFLALDPGMSAESSGKGSTVKVEGPVHKLLHKPKR